jgi:hypothetical protein
VTHAPVDLLARVTPSAATGFRGLDALAVDDRRARAGLGADAVAIQHHRMVVEVFPASVVAAGQRRHDRLAGRRGRLWLASTDVVAIQHDLGRVEAV